jgi:Winged helix DNA-binding domain
MARSVQSRLRVTRRQILAFRRRVGALDERVPKRSESLRRAAWAGLQDSMPRAALLSLHARVEGVKPSTWEDPSLAQLWGPRYHTYVVAKRDFALFSLGRHPENAKGRLRAERLAERLHAHLDGRQMTDRDVAGALGIGYAIRYAATTGTVAIRWEGARAPTVWTVPAAKVDPADACRELGRRYLHIFGPATAEGFASWAGISRRSATDVFASLEGSLLPVRSPLGEGRLLADDEPAIRAAETATAPARLLPSGDAYFLLNGAERELLVPREDQRQRLWTPRVWPGALLVEGEIRGTWRRAHHTVRIDAWARLSRGRRDAIEAEANSLPLPGVDRPIEVVWNTHEERP